MRGVTERHTNRSDLDWWRELAFRLGRERCWSQDVDEQALGRLGANGVRQIKIRS